jgi:hypothetical protein
MGSTAMVSGDVFLADGEDGKLVVTDSKRHKEIASLFVDSKCYFNVKLPKKQKEEIKNKARKYVTQVELLKKEKD